MYRQTWRVIATDFDGMDEVVYVGSDYELALSRKAKVEECGRAYLSVLLVDCEPMGALHLDYS